MPEGVREVTSRRIRRLPPSAREAVEVASVIGREFDFGLLEALGPLSGDDLVAALDEAVRARVLREVDGRVGRYAFAHALVRATLYDGLSALRRARLHSRVGETILARHQDDLDPWLPQLARHFARAAPVEGPARAIDFALAAGRRADRLLAWEEAAAALPRRDARAPGRRAARDRTAGELLLALGASEERAGLEQARATFAEAAELARELDDPVLLARAALGVAGPWSTLGREDPDVVAVLEEALQRAGRGGLAAARAPARAALARALLRGPARAADAAERGVGADRPPDRRPGHARRGARRPPLRALAPRERRGAPRGGGRAAADRRGHRRPRARAGGRRLDRRGPARARRRRRRRRPDRGGRRARRGRAPAAVPVVDVAVPLRARPARRATSRRPSASRARRSRSASAATPRTPCTTTRWRCSTSAASRAGSGRSRRRSRASSRCTRRSRRGAARRR